MKKIIFPCQPVLLVACALILGTAVRLNATELQDICTVGGQTEIQLSGLGLVVGLNGTGDGGKLAPTAKALMAAVQKLQGPTTELDDLKNAKNVALVMVQVVVPKSGASKGQKLDCHITSLGAAKSLRGGRLLWTPLQEMGARYGKEGPPMVAEATGPVSIEDKDIPTSALVSKGVTLRQSIQNPFVDKDGNFLLLIKPSHITFQVTTAVLDAVNIDSGYSSTNQLAKAVSNGVIQVTIPESLRDTPIVFISEILEVKINDPHDKAQVIVNTKTGGVVVTGEVEISPIAFSHKSISVIVGDEDGNRQPGFVSTVPTTKGYEGQTEVPRTVGQLKDLQKALNDLQVNGKDLIDILRMIDASGKLHAEFIEQ
jgi:flagellar P-ring protein FlgI